MKKRIFSDEEIGTIFLPSSNLNEKRRWIAYATSLAGAIIINDGALNALKKNASLLPIGIVGVKNDFEKDDVMRHPLVFKIIEKYENR